MRFLIFGCTSVLILCCASPATADKPNIVFIIADDLGWADVSFHGGNAPTPHLDRLANESAELTQHYVAPVCSPTRVGLLTGRYWSRFGITTPTNERALPWDTITLPLALRARGYQSCLIGKWHLGSLPKWGPNHYGFDHSYGSLAGGVTAWSHQYKKGPFTETWHRNEKRVDEEGHVTDLLTREAVNWIDRRDNQPFFLYVPFTAVHLPINEPESWLAKVPNSIEGEINRHYAACVMHLDDAVGQIVAALKRKGLRQNTILVFTSDNGGSTTTNNTQPYPPDDSPPGNLPADNGILRGQKGTVYEGGTRVPTLVSWPGTITPQKKDSPVCIVDWMPTFCTLAGVQPAKDLNRPTNELRWDGIDLSSWLLEDQPLPQRVIYIAGTRWRSASLRNGRWKLISDLNRKHELYDLVADPAEQHELSARHPDRLQSMLRHLEEIRQPDNDAAIQK